MLFTIANVPAADFIPLATMYRQVRVRRIRIRITGYHTSRVGGVTYTSTTDAAQAERRAREGFQLSRKLGGEMVFLPTHRCGIVPDQNVSTTELGNGLWTQSTGYGLIKTNTRLRRMARWRTGVAFGMRPVYLSFTPTIPYPRKAWAPRSLEGTGSANENRGLLYPVGGTNNTANLSNERNFTLRACPWMDMVSPAGATSATADGGASMAASYGNILSTGSFTDYAIPWALQPMLGLYVGLQGQTATVWPANLRHSISYQLEFRGFRQWETANDFGEPRAYFKEFGLFPTIRNFNF